ncbi:DedA family protein [Desulfopila aestuarii]|uniref:Membrane protein DedA, SNARE-associated domain n=1 Tax=Desulfopila aestuarii DSM 18488 TaxID=1121416 RepID=A0A1M7YK79_9BACT|nr:DedA family protein [Desulfopila aestuarii]SHO53030.1 membrane protein DedA, SNARE-associated domain [Desulfopila aestuarii DSM 18488]
MIKDLMLMLVDGIGSFGYLGIFILMAMESSLIPIPSELVMPPAGYLAQQGIMNPWITILSGTTGSLAGAYANYYVARYLGRPVLFKYGKYFFISPDKLHRIERFFLRHGEISTFIGRLLPVVRHLISIPAGLSGMKHLRFSLYTLLGSLIWCSVLTWIGYTIGRNQELIVMYSKQAVIWASFGSCLLLIVYIFFRRCRVK